MSKEVKAAEDEAALYQAGVKKAKKASTMMGQIKDAESTRRLKNFPDYGLCNTCSNLQGVEREFGGHSEHIVMCTAFGMRLTERNRIRTCTAYHKVGQMSLFQMYEMATTIDPPKPVVPARDNLPKERYL